MLEKLDLDLSLTKEEYKARLPSLQERLFELQSACWKNGVASILVFEGWHAAGVGECLNLLTQKLEPRGFRLYAIQAPRTYETHMPWLWRFWLRVPNYGQMAIFDRSWYRRVLEERVEKTVPRNASGSRPTQDIADFERTLADDGYVVLKFFFHISKKEQKRRFKKVEADPLSSWHVQPEDWERHRKYDKYLDAVEEMLQKTDSEWAPWTMVEATDRRWERVKVFETIERVLAAALRKRGVETPAAARRTGAENAPKSGEEEPDHAGDTRPQPAAHQERVRAQPGCATSCSCASWPISSICASAPWWWFTRVGTRPARAATSGA